MSALWSVICRAGSRTPPSCQVDLGAQRRGPRPRPTAQSAFTLIELLVVVAIIGLLTALTMPAIARTLERGRQAMCTSNQRQLVMANEQYALVEGNYVPAARDIFGANTERWHGQRSSSDASFDGHNGPLYEYLGQGKGIRRCPSIQDVDVPGEVNFEAGCGGYGYNRHGVGSQAYLVGGDHGARAGMDPAQIADPSGTVMFTDTAFSQRTRQGSFLIEYSFAEAYFHVADNSPQETYPTSPSIHFRHLNATIVTWTDGHSSLEAITRHRSQGQTWSNNIGWLNPGNNAWFDPF